MLNEALAEEVERNVRRGEELGSAAGELAVPRALKNMPIPSDSDLTTVPASSSSSQMEGSFAVAEMPTQQNSMAGGSSMDVDAEERETNPGVRKHRTSGDE